MEVSFYSVIINSLATLGASIFRSIESGNQKKASENLQKQNFAFQKSIEENRQAFQVAQMKLAILQHEDTQEFQSKLSEYNHQKALELEEFRQQETKRLQWDLTKLNHENSIELEQFRYQKALELEKFCQQETKRLQWDLTKLNHENLIKLEQFRQLTQAMIHKENLAFQKWQFEQERQLQYEILILEQEFQRELSSNQQASSLEELRERIQFEKSPIINLAFDLLQPPFLDGIMPLRILLSPPILDFDSFSQNVSNFKKESFITEKIRQFMSLGYHINSKERPTELLDKAWESKKYGGGAAINQLYNQLKSIPILILESELVGTDINFRYSYWTGEQTQLVQGSILSEFPSMNFLYASAERKALEWKKSRIKLEEIGKDDADIMRLGGTREHNLKILEKYLKEKKEYEELGIDVSHLVLDKNYKLTLEEYKELDEYLAILHCFVIGITADWLFLKRSFQTKPLLPSLASNLLSKLQLEDQVNQQILDSIVQVYRQLYTSLELEFSHLLPEIMLKFADAFLELCDKSYAVEEANFSVKTWLELNGVSSQRIFNLDNYEDIQVLKQLIYDEDKDYFNLLKAFIDKLDEPNKVKFNKGQNLLNAWKYLKDWKKDLTTSINEILPGDVILEIVIIPAGEFLMGSPEEDTTCWDFERPQHQVTLLSFGMGKYAVTQEQYEAVMGYNPSYFKNKPKHPVDYVTWYDAQDFCKKLSEITGKKYQLPSEAQWEYACRAGTQTYYYFGEDKSELEQYAWYSNNSNNCHHPVGEKKPNNWGLYDMYGNVGEWCEDDWYDNYQDTPANGNARKRITIIEQGKNNNQVSIGVQRGGSWNSNLEHCRSAYRLRRCLGSPFHSSGFRVCLSLF